jgi:predicted metal-dependent HD superfamily phosphohydrolase
MTPPTPRPGRGGGKWSRATPSRTVAITPSSTSASYREYAEAIRFEYSWVPGDVFRTARDGVLRNFLARPFLYRTDAMRQRFEDQARDNIAWELRGFTE